MKRFLFILLCSLLPLSVHAQNGIVQKAETYLAQGKLSEARSLLLEVIQAKSAYPTETLAQALNRLAGFYEKKVGEPKEALRLCRRVMRLNLGRDHPEKRTAGETIERLMHYQTKYATLEQQFGKLRKKSASVQETRSQIKHLKAILNDVPDYPFTGQIYYNIGIKHYQLNNYYRAYSNLESASKHFPGLKFSSPIEFHATTALKNAVRSIILGCAWSILTVAIIVTCALCLGSKSWRLLQGRHLMLLIGTVCLWGGVLYAASWWIGTSRAPGIPNVFDKPTFSANLPGEPGSDILKMLCLYGVIAVNLIYGLHLAMLRCRFSLTGTYMHAVASLMIFSSVFSIFFYRHCEETAVIEKNPQQPLAYLSGNCFFPVSETLQHVLTNIRDYPGLSLDNIDEPEVKDWIRAQYSIIENDKNELNPNRGVRR